MNHIEIPRQILSAGLESSVDHLSIIYTWVDRDVRFLPTRNPAADKPTLPLVRRLVPRVLVGAVVAR